MSQAVTAVGGGRTGDPCVMVIFGAAGDLTRRKLIPALYNLAKYNLLSREFAVIGVARNPMSSDEFRAKLVLDLKEFVNGEIDPDLLEWFQRHVYLHYWRVQRCEHVPAVERTSAESRQRPRHPRQLLLLSRHRA